MATPGMPFSESVTQTLSALYSKGMMIGWGVKYEPFLASATESTELTTEQIKVINNNYNVMV